jgi:predicted AlkP superfamily phosphohydrolase/phosphomutase
MLRLLRTLILLLALAAGLLGRQSAAAPRRKVVLISWDGGADWVIDRLLAAGKLPNVARLAAMGVRAEYCTPAFPSKTAPGHAALWTGAYGDVNGISNNTVPLLPRSEHTLLESRSGFDAEALRAEPIYLTAARAGKRVVVLSATHSLPINPALASAPRERYRAFAGFGNTIAPDRILDGRQLRHASGWTELPPHSGTPREFSIEVGDAEFQGLVYDDLNDPVQGADSLLIRQGSKNAKAAEGATVLKPSEAARDTRGFSRRFAVRKGDLAGYTYFRLFELAPDGRMTLYQRAADGLSSSTTPEETRRYLDAYGGFHAAPWDEYGQGQLGKPVWAGGDGTAERRMLEIVRLDCELLERGTRWALKEWRPDLLLHYTPMSDSAGHTWMGYLDPDGPRYDPAVARRLWPFYEEVFALQDRWLGSVLDAVDRDTAVCLVSDHGMAAAGKLFFPNAVLEKAGLLARKPDGEIDLAQTRICAPPWGGQFVAVNGTDWKGGIVRPEQRAEVLHAAAQALLAARDPETGGPVVMRVFRPEETAGLGIGGLSGGDLYLDPAPGYAPSNGLVDTGEVSSGGTHGGLSLRPKLHAIFYLGGAGVSSGRRIGGMRQVDVAPTLCRLLGIPAPKDAVGHAIGEALE